MNTEKKYTIATGNPFEGIRLLGIFDHVEEASDYADALDAGEWWVVAIDEAQEI